MSNRFALDLWDRFDRSFARDTEAMTYSDWVTQHTTLRGRPFSMNGYEFQEALLNDLHPRLVCKKCSQVGLTEVQIRKALAFVKRNRGVNAIFTIAEEKLFKKVAKSRILPIVKHDRVFNSDEDEGSSRSMDLMQFGHSFLYVTACTEGDATSTPADALFKDEVDLSPQDMLALLSSRLQNSSYKINQEFSTPTFPGYGIDKSFETTDQRLYMCKCERCNHWNWPTFSRAFIHMPGLPDHVEEMVDIDALVLDEIDLLNSYVKCEKCHGALDLGNSALREWVAQYPNRYGHGYWVSPFSTDRLTVNYMVDQLLDYRGRQFIRGFHNTVLGNTYTDGSMQLTEEAIRLAMAKGEQGHQDIGPQRPISIGIDMGQACHVAICDAYTREFLGFHIVPVNELNEWLKRFCAEHRVIAGGIDRHPYTPTSNAIRDMTEGVIMPIEYAATGKSFVFHYEPDNPEKISHTRANRTMLLDAFAGRVRAGTAVFNGYTSFAETLVDHLRGMWRDEQPEQPAVWKKLHTRDHFFHACGYALAGLQIRDIEESQQDSEIRTMCLGNTVSVAPSSPLVLQPSRKQAVQPSIGFARR